MFNDLLKSFAQSTVQDVVTAAAGWLAVHGWLTPGQQEQAWIGSGCFLLMWAFNGYMQHTQTKGTNS